MQKYSNRFYKFGAGRLANNDFPLFVKLTDPTETYEKTGTYRHSSEGSATIN
jgi:hypothetical protein